MATKTDNDSLRKEDIISLLKKWADGYTYILIPVEDAIREVEQFTDTEVTDTQGEPK